MERLNLNLTEVFVDTAHDAIKNLQTMSKELERLSMSPKNYNTGFAAYLEQLSHEMYRSSNELKSLVSMYGDV